MKIPRKTVKKYYKLRNCCLSRVLKRIWKNEQVFVTRKFIWTLREYWMINRWPGFLAVVWFGSSPSPFSPFPVSNLSLFLSLPVCHRSSLLTGNGGKGWGLGRGAKSYDRNTAWPSINHAILSVYSYCERQIQLNMQFISPIILYTPYPLNVHNHLFYWMWYLQLILSYNLLLLDLSSVLF